MTVYLVLRSGGVADAVGGFPLTDGSMTTRIHFYQPGMIKIEEHLRQGIDHLVTQVKRGNLMDQLWCGYDAPTQ